MNDNLLNTENIGIENLRLFLLNDRNFIQRKGDCTTFWVQRGFMIKDKKGSIIQMIFLSCSGSELLWIENGKFVKKKLSKEGESICFSLLEK